MFAFALSKDVCHAYGKHIEIKPVTQHNIVYSQRKKLTIWCKFLDIENSVSYNSDTMCGHGGIGRRVRLRGVWDDRVSSSLTGRTKKKNQVNRLGFFYASVRLVLGFAQRAYGTNSHCVSGAQLLCASTLFRYFVTPFLTSTYWPHQRQAKACLFFASVRLVLGFAQRAYGTNSHSAYRDASLFE